MAVYQKRSPCFHVAGSFCPSDQPRDAHPTTCRGHARVQKPPADPRALDSLILSPRARWSRRKPRLAPSVSSAATLTCTCRVPRPLPPLRPPKPATTSRGARPVLRHPPPHGARSRVPGDGSGSSASMVARPRDPLQWRRRPSRRRCVRDGGRASGLPFTLTLILCSKKP
jgi:hypothetical protein